MEELYGQTIKGEIVEIKEGDEIGKDGAFVEVIIPDFRNGVHRAYVRRADMSIGVVRIFESAFVTLDTAGNGKSYSEYPDDVRVKANLFTKDEVAAQKAEQAKARQEELKTGKVAGRSF